MYLSIFIISTKEMYSITPAAKDMEKDNQLVFLDLLNNTIKLPKTVDKPANNVIEKATKKALSIVIF